MRGYFSICAGGLLQRCNPTGTAFETLEDCGAQGRQCDALGQQCDLCVPGATTCHDAVTASTCQPDGQGTASVACPAETPFCTGNGKCVACTTATQCPAAPDVCSEARCDGNQCGLSPVPVGATCDGGVCNGGGLCGACKPGDVRCGENTPESCSSKGEWIKGSSCGGATPLCSGGKCGTCSAGTADCDGNSANGCEAAPADDVLNCGGCGNVCSTLNATPSCVAGSCSLACAAGFGSCDGNVANGCETNLDSSVNSCGQCGKSCTVANGSPACVGGACRVKDCTGPFADCDGQYATGCEADTRGDVANCGGCGKKCSSEHGTPSCGGGVCAISCTAGFANCDANAANGCEIDLQTDGGNCGRCGHDCQGGACVAGACQPVVLVSGSGRVPVTVVVDASTLYFTDLGTNTVEKCAKSGCGNAPTPLATGQAYPVGLAIDDTHAYWVANGSGAVRTCPKVGCQAAIKTLATLTQPRVVKVDGSSLYFTAGPSGNSPNVLRCTKTSCTSPPYPFAPGPGDAWGVGLDATSVYWVDHASHKLFKCNTAGCGGNPQVLASGLASFATGLASDGNDVYFVQVEAGTVLKCSTGGCGSSPTPIASGQGRPLDVIVDGAELYWVNDTAGTVVSCAKAGCGGSPKILASGQTGAGSLASDATSLYWARPGAVMKLAKP